MPFHRFPDIPFRLLQGVGSRDAAGKIRNVRCPIALRPFENHREPLPSLPDLQFRGRRLAAYPFGHQQATRPAPLHRSPHFSFCRSTSKNIMCGGRISRSV